MKLIHNKATFIISISLIIFSAASCKKWLDVQPRTEVQTDVLFEDENGFKEALTGIYIKLTGENLYGRELTFGLLDVLGKQHGNLFNSTNHYYNAGLYDYTAADVQTHINAIWTESYNIIANINMLLQHIDQEKGVFTGDNYSIIKGEALGLRALIHFDMLRLFAPSFASNSSAPAIPYITTVAKNVTPQSSVSATADLIIKDLQDAAGLLKKDPLYTGSPVTPQDDNGYLLNRNLKFNYYAVKSLQARVYLYKSDKPNALLAAKEVIAAADKFPWVNRDDVSGPNPALRDRVFASELVFTLFNQNMIDQIRNYLNFENVAGYGLPMPDDLRREVFETDAGIGSSDFRNVYLFDNSGPNIYSSKLWQPAGIPAAFAKRMPMIRISELYYIAAESEPVTAQAVTYLNVVRTHRGIVTDLPPGISTTDLTVEIFKEYRKEFIGEGQLFYYYKRMNAAKIGGVSGIDDKEYVLPLPDAETEYGRRDK